MELCTTPKQPYDRRYVSCTSCTWHDVIDKAEQRRDLTPCCPFCGSTLYELPSQDDFEALARSADQSHAGMAAMLEWSRGKTFPDHDTLENAYRQAMEGTE